VFRLDAIARELKVVDENLKAIGAGTVLGEGKPPSEGSLTWCRGHVKDVINQCLTETHKLHIGAASSLDPGANGGVIAGSGKKAYLIVDQALFPDATSLDDVMARTNKR
jgi:hypothetical protein